MNKFFSAVIGAAMAAVIALASTAALAGSAPAGTFKGASDHITKGGVSVIKTAGGGHIVILDKDFSLDGAPDARVGFGKGGKYDASTDLGPLVNINGLQAYVVSGSVDVSKFDEVYIWCRKFNVPLGVASLK